MLKPLQAIKFKKKFNIVIKFTIFTHLVACILSRSGATINEGKDNTDIQIDIDKTFENSFIINITIYNTKAIIAISIFNQITKEIINFVYVKSRFYYALISAGDQNL